MRLGTNNEYINTKEGVMRLRHWHERAKQIYRQNKNYTYREIAELISLEFGEYTTANAVKKVILRDRWGGRQKGQGLPQYTKEEKADNINIEEVKKKIIKDLRNDCTEEMLCTKHRITDVTLEIILEDLRDEGYQITDVNNKYRICKDIIHKENIHTHDWQGNKIIRFGIVSDNHLGSKWQQITHLNTLYDIYSKEGIDTVYNAGDLTEGVNMRQGHEYEVFKHGSDEQADYVVVNYPKRIGIVTKFITGNHDHSGIRHAGHDIGTVIGKREDMEYLGMANAKINLTPNCLLEINHPLDGSAYALSYQSQRRIESMSGGEKPNILVDGHHHKMLKMFYRNIHAFEAGTTQAQTPWMRGKRLAAHMGGWLIELRVDEEGTIVRCISEWIPFYVAVEHDY